MPDRSKKRDEKISVWEDLRQRNVYRVGVGYAAVAWLAIEVSETIVPRLGLPDWSVTMVLVVAMLGLPVALFLGWTLEITPKGIVFDKPRHASWRTYLIIDLVIVAFLASAGSIYWFRIHELNDPRPATAENSIAVLRFLNISDDPGNGYLSDGLTEELIHEFTNLKSFKVASRTSVWPLSTSELQVTEIADRLNVRRVLEGSVRAEGDRIRVTAQLIDNDGFHLWSNAYDRQRQDILEIQKEIAAQVVLNVDLLLANESKVRLTTQPTIISAAYDEYLQGRQQLRKPSNPESLSAAQSLFEASIDSDDRFPLAYAGLCETHLARYRLTRAGENFNAAELACHRALTLDGGLADVYAALGDLYRHSGQNDKAEQEYETALAINPTLEEANFGLGRTYQAQGRLEEAETTLRRSVELEPGYWGAHMGVGNFLHRQGRYAEAIPFYVKVTKLVPDYAGGFINLGSALHWIGDWDSAEVAWRRSLELNPDSMAFQNMGTLHYYKGRFADSVNMQKEAIKVSPSDHRAWGRLADAERYVPDQNIASQESYREAIKLVKSQLAINPDEPEDLAYLSIYLANTGESDAAGIAANRGLDLAPENPNVHYAAAIVELNSDNPDGAINQLNMAASDGYSLRLLAADPEFASISDQPKFQALMTSGAYAYTQ